MLLLYSYTRSPFDLRHDHPRICVHLVTGSYFRSRNKDGGHAIWSVVAENPIQHVHFTALCVIDTVLLAMEFSHCGHQDLWRRAGCRCKKTGWLSTFLLLWPWPWPDDLYIRTLPVLPTPGVQVWTSYVKALKVIVWQTDDTDRQTDRIEQNNKPRLFAGGQQVRHRDIVTIQT